MRQKQISGRTLTFEERICTILQAVDRVPHRRALRRARVRDHRSDTTVKLQNRERAARAICTAKLSDQTRAFDRDIHAHSIARFPFEFRLPVEHRVGPSSETQ